VVYTPGWPLKAKVAEPTTSPVGPYAVIVFPGYVGSVIVIEIEAIALEKVMVIGCWKPFPGSL
jgi:hypothetical protein